MSQFIYRPFAVWTRARTLLREDAPFRSAFGATRDLLEFELEKLDAKNAVVEVGAHEFLRSGLPRQNEVWHPGIALLFDSKRGPLAFATDRFNDWRDNLRAIALALEALRKIDRYSVSQSGEQYRGWAALPPATPNTQSETFASREDAALWLQKYFLCALEPLLNNEDIRKSAYQKIARQLHPDAGGDPTQFRKLQNAKAMLENTR